MEGVSAERMIDLVNQIFDNLAVEADIDDP